MMLTVRRPQPTARVSPFPAGLGLVLIALVACDASPVYVIDARPTPDGVAPGQDAGEGTDGGGPTFATVSVSGCAALTAVEGGQRCLGPAPLALHFSAVAPPEATTFLWEFGDGSEPEVLPTVTHVYAYPGEYRVVLVIGGGFGTFTPSTSLTVAVDGAGVGAWCEDAAQCATGDCLCAGEGAADCPAALRGVCTAACDACPPEDRCVDLRLPGSAPEWRATYCLPACSPEAPCARPGQVCRELPVQYPPGVRQWQAVCFPDVLADVGEGCATADGTPVDAACLSGRCLDLGAFGQCSDGCATSPCPGHAACAVMSGGPHAGEPLCLARCSAERPCTDDPLLACQAADPAGDLGFTVLDASALPETSYCAPRRCETAVDCPTGLCAGAPGGFCR
jgi:hypothetical protein